MNKRLILIEVDMAPSTPSAKSICKAIPHILDAGWQVEIWSSAMKLTDSRLVWKRIPRISRIGHIQFWFFSIWVTVRYALARLNGGIKRDTVVQSVGPYLLWANFPSIHFVSVEYLRQIKSFAGMVRPSWHERIAHSLVSLLERCMWRLGSGRRSWQVVSEQLCRDLENHVKTGDQFQILPNTYDSIRFNPGVRRKWRNDSRAKLGISLDEPVFVFVSLGSFERKGLPLALQACELLNRRKIGCRLLIVGGPTESPPDISSLAAKAGVRDLSFVVTHGRDPGIERLLSAADALLFPSYSEAFSLVEIEAAALGLRLYLTPHYGSEMILQDGSNGRLLPWDAGGIADVLEADIRQGELMKGCVTAGRAVPESEFGALYLAQLESAHTWITRKC